jgi:hypothetical protein
MKRVPGDHYVKSQLVFSYLILLHASLMVSYCIDYRTSLGGDKIHRPLAGVQFRTHPFDTVR